MARSEFHSICRICIQELEHKNGSAIFNNDAYNDNISLSERIKYCSSVEVNENDGLPSQICSSCLNKLNQSFVFRNQCVLADITLRHFVKNPSFNIVEVINSLNIDLENQIITSSNTFFNMCNDLMVCNFNNFKDISWQTNGTLLEDVKTCNNLNENNFTIINNISGDEKIKLLLNDCHEIESLKEKKDKCKSNLPSNNSLHNSYLKSAKKLKLCKKKRIDEKCDDQLDLNFKSEAEKFTIEPDIPGFNGMKNQKTENETAEINISKFRMKSVKKAVKPKSLGKKKGRSKKLETSKEKPSSYTCNYCQKVYPSEGGWRYHIHTMHNENYQPFICDLCGQSFKVKKNLEGHKNSIHFHLKLHLCDLCGRGFASKYALKVHKIWHNDEKDYACDICGTKFRTRGKLNTHKSIHGGPKNFMCHICSRNFRWKKDFEVHMRTHTGEKPFKCSHCEKAFASLTNMRKHERNHLEKMISDKKAEPKAHLNPIRDNSRLFKDEFMDFVYSD